MTKFYENALSPYSSRVAIVLAEKQVKAESVHIELGKDKPAWFQEKVSSKGKVPVFEHNGKIITESLLIAEYIDATFEPRHDLFPLEPVTHASIRAFCKTVDDLPSLALGVMQATPEEQPARIEAAKAGIAALEEKLTQSSGPFFLGAKFSLADIAVIPFIDRLRYLVPAVTGGKFHPLSEAPRLQQLFQAAQRRASFSKGSLSGETYIKALSARFGIPMESAKMTHYYNPVCPFAVRVRIATALTKAPVDEVKISLKKEEREDWYRKLNPADKVPTLIPADSTVPIVESDRIVEYIALRYTDHVNLFPEDPLQVVTGQLTIDFFNTNVLSHGTTHYFSKDEAEKAQALVSLKAGLEAFESQIAGPFLLGASTTMFDVVLAPFLHRMKGYGLPAKASALLATISENKEVEAILKELA